MKPVVMNAVHRSGRLKSSSDTKADAYARAFVQVVHAGLDDPEMATLTQNPIIGAWGAALLGTNGLRILLDDIFLKLPGAGPTPWHQDSSISPVDPQKVITAWIPLQTTTPQMGGLRVVPHSHHKGLWGPVDISEETQREFTTIIKQQQFSIIDLPTMNPGDVSFHNGCTIHGAYPNDSQSSRLVLALHCFADGLNIIEQPNIQQQEFLERFAPDLSGGDLAKSPNWPHLFSFS